MKAQTVVLLLCFLAGVFLSVVHAKPSPALMRELKALEKFLDKKQGPEGADGQDENPGEKPLTDEEMKTALESVLSENGGKNEESQNLGQEGENQPPEHTDNKPDNENNNNEADETNTEEGSGGAGEQAPHAGENPAGEQEGIPHAKPEEGVPPENTEGSSGSDLTGEGAPHEEEGSPASGGEGNEEKPEEGNEPGPSEGQEEIEKGRDQSFEVLDAAIRKIQDALGNLRTLSDDFRKLFQTDDRKLKELEDTDEQTKEKTKEKLGLLNNVVHEINGAFGVEETPSTGGSGGEKSKVPPVRGNAPSRKSDISDTEYLRTLYSLLRKN